MKRRTFLKALAAIGLSPVAAKASGAKVTSAGQSDNIGEMRWVWFNDQGMFAATDHGVYRLDSAPTWVEVENMPDPKRRLVWFKYRPSKSV